MFIAVSPRKVQKVVQVIDCGYCKQYETRVLIDDAPYESAVDFSIKASEQLAAEKTYKRVTQAEG